MYICFSWVSSCSAFKVLLSLVKFVYSLLFLNIHLFSLNSSCALLHIRRKILTVFLALKIVKPLFFLLIFLFPIIWKEFFWTSRLTRRIFVCRIFWLNFVENRFIFWLLLLKIFQLCKIILQRISRRANLIKLRALRRLC